MFARILAACLLSAVLVTPVHSQDQEEPTAPPQPPEQVTAPEVPAANEYTEVLKRMEGWCERFDKLESYKDTVISQGEEKKKFTELTPFEKNMFVIFSGQTCANQMMQLYNVWDVERQQLMRLEVLRQGGQAAAARQGEVTSQQLADNLASLRKLQKGHAKRFETAIERIFEEFKEEIPEKDAKLYIQNVRKFHDRYDLIERSPEQDNE